MARLREIGLAGLIAFLMSLVPASALAHEGESLPYGSFLGGLTHPALGFDHLLAMLSVGALSAQIGGRAIWTVPTTFVSVMALGGVLGLVDAGLSATEIGIALSLVVLGLAIAAEKKLPALLAMAAVGFFAVFHGYAHGAEMPAVADPLLYALGFLSGTAAIHITGLVIGDIAQHYEIGRSLLRVSGGMISVVGLLFIFGVL